MTITLRPQNDQVTQQGDQAMAAYRQWRERMMRRPASPLLPPAVPAQRQDSSKPA